MPSLRQLNKKRQEIRLRCASKVKLYKKEASNDGVYRLIGLISYRGAEKSLSSKSRDIKEAEKRSFRRCSESCSYNGSMPARNLYEIHTTNSDS